ncbi:MAG: hypothetical protein Q9162_002603 [Coniocarpon cinnabarinum]
MRIEGNSKSDKAKRTSRTSKKGVAKKPPSLSKKRKKNDGSPAAPASMLSATSYTKKKGVITATPTFPQSSTPVSPAQDSETESVEDENVVYCICRRPDNHTWMIGCDGGCEDWFHGKCVGVRQEDEELIDRYICPNCTERAVGVTTWKPMCRRPSCNRPARLRKGAESKYCSTTCGNEFWKEQVVQDNAAGVRGYKTKKRGHEEANIENETVPNPLGGALQPQTLKSLISAVDDATAFRRLGSPEAMTPPNSRPGTSNGILDADLDFNEHEKSLFAAIEARKTKLRSFRVALKEREDFVRLTRERAGRAKERHGGKAICGYDGRLAWDEVSFQEWRECPAGQSALDKGTLSPPPEDAEKGMIKICERKSCGRHVGWAKLALQEVRFDEEHVRAEMKELLAEEERIKRQAQGRKKGLHAAREDEVDLHGWVEVV